MTSDSDSPSNNDKSEDISSDEVPVKQKVRRKSSSELKYICPHEGCGQKFKRNTYLDRHEYQTHTKIKKHVCTMEGCDKRYTIITHLTRHIRTFHQKKHEGEPRNRIKCNIATCMRQFNTISNMERHIRQYHENPKIYDCPECSFKCRHKLQFYRHLETHQSGGKKPKPNKKTHSCEICKEIFTKWSELISHRKKSHPPKCAMCGRTFTKASNLRSHLLNHKKKVEKSMFACPYDECTRSYAQKRNLQEHIQVHHEGKKFECPILGCNKVLRSKRRLDCHVELHSKDDIEIVRKKPAERKDKGVKKVSAISILAGIAVRKDVDKMLIAGRGNDIDIECSSFITTSDSDGEELLVSKNVRLIPLETD